ncbi:MAG: rRNA maturation RNase YbeY [Elusimicrobiota bacterium]
MGRKGLNVLVAGLRKLPPSSRRPKLFARAVKTAFARERSKAQGEVSVVFLPRDKMRALNRQFLGHDHDTDVISFEHDILPVTPAGERPVGDIYISSWMAVRQAKQLGHGVLHEALSLAVHGALHLLGHDDTAPRQKALMFRRQDEILAKLER